MSLNGHSTFSITVHSQSLKYDVLNAILFRKEGNEKQVDHNKAISASDMELFAENFKNAADESLTSSVLLTEYCWFVMTVHFLPSWSETPVFLEENILYLKTSRDEPPSG